MLLHSRVGLILVAELGYSSEGLRQTHCQVSRRKNALDHISCSQARERERETAYRPRALLRRLDLLPVSLLSCMAVQKWTNFVKFLRFTQAITLLEKETFTEYVALRFQEFSERLLARQVFADLLEETFDETDNSVPERVLEYGQRLQAQARRNHG